MSGEERLEIGFAAVNPKAELAFPFPRMLLSSRDQPLSGRAVQACPAVNTFENRVIELLAPFSLRLRCIQSADGKFNVHIIPEGTRIDSEIIKRFVSVMPRGIWRSEQFPVVQIALPHFFISDDTCYLTQTPAWASNSRNNIPGPVISGRFPTNIWPRSLNLAFEWQIFEEDLVLKRGQPCCYLLVEGSNPDIPIRLFPAELSTKLKDYREKIEGVVKFTSGSFNLFDQALKIRPQTLLEEKRL